MAKLSPKLARETALDARSFLAVFNGQDFGEFAPVGPHDRRHLAIALDYVEELTAIVLALTGRPNEN